MDRKRAILDYVCDERLDLLEQLNERELQLQETTVPLSDTQDLSSLKENYRSVVESVENMLNSLDELEEKVLKSRNL